MAFPPPRSVPLKDWERADKLNIELIGYGWYVHARGGYTRTLAMSMLIETRLPLSDYQGRKTRHGPFPSTEGPRLGPHTACAPLHGARRKTL